MSGTTIYAALPGDVAAIRAVQPTLFKTNKHMTTLPLLNVRNTVSLPMTTISTLEADLTNMSTSDYPRPPYAGADEAFYSDPCPLQAATMRRAMETGGRVFKQMTEWVPGLKYMYWHEDRKGTELWYQSARHPTANNEVFAFYQAIRSLEDRLMFVILRPGRGTPDPTEQTWALTRLVTFQSAAEHRLLFELPDWTAYGYPAWTLTPPMQDAMDAALYASGLTKGDTLLYDRRRCTVAWIRRDGAAYEIRARYVGTVVFAQRFILRTLVQVVSHLLHTDQAYALPPNAVVWIETYFQMQQHMAHSSYGRGQTPRSEGNWYQARKGKKRQRLGLAAQ